MSLLEMKQLFMWLLQKIMKITGKWISRLIFWKKHVRPQAILWTVIAQPTCMRIAHVMACMRFPNMAFPNSDIWRVRIRIYFILFYFYLFIYLYIFFFFFLRVSPMSFLKLRETRATRVFYTGEIIVNTHQLTIHTSTVISKSLYLS